MDYGKAFSIVFKYRMNMCKIRKIFSYNYKMHKLVVYKFVFSYRGSRFICYRYNEFSLPSSFWNNGIIFYFNILLLRVWRLMMLLVLTMFHVFLLPISGSNTIYAVAIVMYC